MEFHTAHADNMPEGFHVELNQEDVGLFLKALSSSDERVQSTELSTGKIWIKRQGTENARWWISIQAFLSRLVPYKFMRPSPILDAAGMAKRELDKIDLLSSKGFPVPQVVYTSSTAFALRDIGKTIATMLSELRHKNHIEHDALLVKCANDLGLLHAAGLCHGRPHMRDFFLENDRIGFMDFEEEPELVMPLEVAQARDLWLLFLPLSLTSIDKDKTLQNAYAQWEKNAPQLAKAELKKMIDILSRFLPLVRLIGRVRMGSDLRRFILATEFLKSAVNSDAVLSNAGKAGNK